jgi:predicted RNA-binding protein (virulence factor B family)
MAQIGWMAAGAWVRVKGMAVIGKRNALRVIRDSKSGLYLDGDELGEILLPNRYVPRQFSRGDRIEVFIYRDSEDRLVATTETPRASAGEVASLRVVSIHHRMGAFLDWGLSKDLLLPFREQTRPLAVGEDVMVRVYVDPKSQRIVASMRLERGAEKEKPAYRSGEQVEFVISEQTALGYKAFVEGQHWGLLYRDRVSVPVAVGQKLKGFVRAVRPDGKLDLSLDQTGYQRVGSLALRIVDELQRHNGKLTLDDDSSPEAIRQAFGASKKAFKQAVGSLYKARRIRFCKPGMELLDNSNWSPSSELPRKERGR